MRMNTQPLYVIINCLDLVLGHVFIDINFVVNRQIQNGHGKNGENMF